MKTKAELEAEVNDLKVRVAELEGAIEAYRFALEHVNPQQAQSGYYYWPNTQWYNNNNNNNPTPPFTVQLT